MLYGDAGTDSLDGGAGNDQLLGGAGADVLTGGTGSDRFYAAAGYGADTVTDFSHAQGDLIDVINIMNVHSLSDIAARATQSGANTVIDFGAGDTLTLSNVAKSSLVAGDFAFNTLIEGYGSSGLDIIGYNYAIFALNSSYGVFLNYQGIPVSLNQFAGWTAIGAEYASGIGYEVAWKSASGYWLWTTDLSGNFQSGTMYSATDLNFISQETLFQQDLNGDGRIGPPPPTVIESAGATSLVQVGSNYYLYPSGGSSGPVLSYHGSVMVAGQAGGFVPIGAEQSGGGYKVVWQGIGGADQYTIWTADSNGAHITNTPVASGSDTSIKSLEATFQQDLNGDGTVGLGIIGGGGGAGGSAPLPPPPPPPISGSSEQDLQIALGVGLGTLGAPDAASPSSGSDTTAASLALLTNYMASAFAPTAAMGPVAGAQTLTAEDVLTKPLA